jgi:hypothetical protein
MRKFGAVTASLAVAGLMAASPAVAANSVTTFASFNATGNNNIVWANSGSNGTSSTYDASGAGGSLYTAKPNGAQPDSYSKASVDITFSFLQAALSSVSNVKAKFELDLASNMLAADLFGTVIQPGLGNNTLSFRILTDEVITVNGVTYDVGTNLLSGALTSGVRISGEGTAGGVRASTLSGAQIVYNSAFLNFNATTTRDFALSLSAITSLVGGVNQGLNAPGGNLRSFKATATGSFSSDPAPLIGVPEPATWAMMIAGFGLLGVSLRRRRVEIAA